MDKIEMTKLEATAQAIVDEIVNYPSSAGEDYDELVPIKLGHIRELKSAYLASIATTSEPVAYTDPASLTSLHGTPAKGVYLSKTKSPAYSMALYARPVTADALHIVFTAYPGPGSECVFVEVETPAGKSVNAGEWRPRADGLVELVLTTPPAAPTAIDVAIEASDSFNAIVDAVEARCLATDGPVTPTLAEMREDELSALWRAVQGIRASLKATRETA